MSDSNQFEKFVLGDAKKLAKCGPVREGVSQTFASSTKDAKVGTACAVYTAANDGGAAVMPA